MAYQFFVNRFGVQADIIENEMTGEESDAWGAIWQSAGQTTESGYQVEMAIPLNVLNFDGGNQQKTWGIEFVRFYPQEESYRISHRPLDRNNSCTLCQLAEVTGFEQRDRAGLRPDPSILSIADNTT